MSDWHNLGVGGLLALLVLREVFGFITRFKMKDTIEVKSNPMDYPQFWEARTASIQDSLREVVDQEVLPVLKTQTDILGKVSDTLIELKTIATSIEARCNHNERR